MNRLPFFINAAPVPSEWEIAVFESTVISVLRMRQADNSIKYKVSNGGGRFALNVKTEHFDYESMPSNREENHADLYRYDDFDQAIAAAQRVAKIIKAEMEERRERMLENQKQLQLDRIRQMESEQNEGRGVSCVRGMISSVDQGDIAGAKVWFTTDHDKLRQYPQLKQALGNYLCSFEEGPDIKWLLEMGTEL